MTAGLKGIRQPSHEAQRPSERMRAPFRVGRRYPIPIVNALALEEKLQAYLKKGEGVDLARLTRFEGPGLWIVWTTTGRKVEVTATNGVIEDAKIDDEADPDVPPIAR